ncbi:hypothetical protein [Micromonospora sp. CPCC 206061]|uniref:hypothetical protein n=1 Tax=Micromonospora sp. CPCC 206061 TaxID=3122410 RepID=UPI002FF1EF69
MARLLIDLVRGMDLDGTGLPLWAEGGNCEEHIARSLEEFEAVPGQRYRVTAEFPPAIGAKLVGVADGLSVAVSEVVRAEIRQLMTGRANGSRHTTHTQLALPTTSMDQRPPTVAAA